MSPDRLVAPQTRPRSRPALRTVVDYESFYVANIDRLTRSLMATLGSQAAAQDAAQEAMVKAYHRWDEVSTFSNPMGWCYRVGLRQGQSAWRKLAREHLTDRFASRPSIDREEHLDPDVIEALLTLPLSQRSVIVLRVFMGWSLEETADALGIATGSVSGRYKRGMDRLREALAVTRPELRVLDGGAE